MPPEYILLSADTFDPWKVQALSHRLSDHPLLQIDALIELSKRQQARKLVRSHTNVATASTSFADAPTLHPNPKSPAETLAELANAKAWMSLLNVQADPVYRELIDDVLNSIRPIVDRSDSGMCYRAGWIFVTSPGTITPFHIDHEHNFIMQIKGNKRLYVWDPFDRSVVSEQGRELFHDQHSRDLVTWREEFREKATVFDLEPGMGGYMPSTAPHLVENGNAPSITISFTYYTDDTRRRERLYRGNARLRRLGLEPHAVGDSSARDTLKVALIGGYETLRAAVRRARGLGVRNTGVPYAPA